MKTSTSIKAGLLALVAVSALSAPLVYAGKGNHGNHDGFHSMEMRGGNKGGMLRMLRKLDLTDQQQTDIKALVEQHRETMQAKRPSDEERLANRTSMMELMTAPDFDENQAIEIIAVKQAKHQQAMLARFKLQNTVYQMLTPEQQTELKAKFEEFATSKRGHKGW